MANYIIIAGTTVALRFQLLEAGAPIDLTDATVELLLADKNGNTVSSPGTVTILDEANGVVQLVPTSTTVFVSSRSPYMARWKITDSDTKISYVPTGPRDLWSIVGA